MEGNWGFDITDVNVFILKDSNIYFHLQYFFVTASVIIFEGVNLVGEFYQNVIFQLKSFSITCNYLVLSCSVFRLIVPADIYEEKTAKLFFDVSCFDLNNVTFSNLFAISVTVSNTDNKNNEVPRVNWKNVKFFASTLLFSSLPSVGPVQTTIDELYSANGTYSTGGAIFISGVFIGEIRNSIFFNCSADYGGAIYISPFVITGFGALYLKFIDCLFHANLATVDGGAIFAYSQYVRITFAKVDFVSNLAERDGGALFLQFGIYPQFLGGSSFICILDQVLFKENSALRDGGAMLVQSPSAARYRLFPLLVGYPYTVNIESYRALHFFSNRAGRNGGGILFSAPRKLATILWSSVYSSQVIFEGNRADNGKGGAFALIDTTLTRKIKKKHVTIFFKYYLPTVIIENNHAKLGGGMYLEGALLNNGLFHQHTKTLLSNNTADIGGALVLAYSTTLYDNSWKVNVQWYLFENKAKYCGNEIFLVNGFAASSLCQPYWICGNVNQTEEKQRKTWELTLSQTTSPTNFISCSGANIPKQIPLGLEITFAGCLVDALSQPISGPPSSFSLQLELIPTIGSSFQILWQGAKVSVGQRY